MAITGKNLLFVYALLFIVGRRGGRGEATSSRKKNQAVRSGSKIETRALFSYQSTPHLHPPTHSHLHRATLHPFTPAQAMTTATRGGAARGVFRRGGVLVVLSLLLGAAMMVQANDKTRPFTRLQSTTGGGADGQQQQHPQQEELLERQQQRRRRRQQEAASGSDRKSSREGKEGGMMNVSFRRRERPRPPNSLLLHSSSLTGWGSCA